MLSILWGDEFFFTIHFWRSMIMVPKLQWDLEKQGSRPTKVKLQVAHGNAIHT
jgi:hypothetical protein